MRRDATKSEKSKLEKDAISEVIKRSVVEFSANRYLIINAQCLCGSENSWLVYISLLRDCEQVSEVI